jgi:ribosomal protein S19
MKLYNVVETAKELNVTPQTIRNHIREGKITPIRVGKSIIITEKEIDKRRKRNEYKRV